MSDLVTRNVPVNKRSRSVLDLLGTPINFFDPRTDKIGSLGPERMRKVLGGIALVFGLDDPDLHTGS